MSYTRSLKNITIVQYTLIKIIFITLKQQNTFDIFLTGKLSLFCGTLYVNCAKTKVY